MSTLRSGRIHVPVRSCIRHAESLCGTVDRWIVAIPMRKLEGMSQKHLFCIKEDGLGLPELTVLAGMLRTGRGFVLIPLRLLGCRLESKVRLIVGRPIVTGELDPWR